MAPSVFESESQENRIGKANCARTARMGKGGKISNPPSRRRQNELKVEVANLAVNYLAGISLPNYNYARVTARYGDRFQPQDLALVQVQPAGLLGPVRIIAGGGEE